MLARLRSFVRAFTKRQQFEDTLSEELRFHLDAYADDLIEKGLSRKEAYRQARVHFGGVERVRDECRQARGLRVVDELILDLRLGIRLLVKSPGLTLVGGLSMAVAIAIGAGSFSVIYALMDPTLPLDEGDRIVSIQNADTSNPGNPHRRSVHDFVAWRDELKSVEDLGAFRLVQRNLVAPDGQAEPIHIAEMTAAGFRVARVPPQLGRYFDEEDEREGAAPVVVIGYDAWQSRFGGDPDIVGRTLQLGRSTHTVVGVMPEGFGFPIAHRFWSPLRLDPSGFDRGQGPSINIFGRLAPGVTLRAARAELTTVGQRMAVAFPDTHALLRPQVMPYAYPFSDIDSPDMVWKFHLLQVVISLLLVVVSVNVAILVYARTATRQREIAVRSALGASRRRIVGQLFAEALVLAAAAAAVGLTVAELALGQVDAILARQMGDVPFWMDFGVSFGTVVYVAGLAVLAAMIVGVLPALKATGRRVHAGLQGLGSGGSGMQLGRTWTVLIVAQVAVAVGVLPAAVFYAWESARYGVARPGFATEEFLTTWLYLDDVAESGDYESESAPRYAGLQAELVRRLEAEPSVSDVIITSTVPGNEPTVTVEVEGVPGPAAAEPALLLRSTSHRVGIGRVDIDFFDTFDVPILTGRGFGPGDVAVAASAVIVNQSFVEEAFGGGNALGRHVRSLVRRSHTSPGSGDPGRWYEIVGVVGDFPNPVEPGLAQAKLYHPRRAGQDYPVSLALRVRGAAPSTVTDRLRAIATALDPTLRLGPILTLDEVLREDQGLMRLLALAIALVTLSVLLLSAAGIYSLMSFTVARRRREIGIRSALGAHPRRLLWSIFSLALGQLTVGVVVGLAAAALLDGATGGELLGGESAVLLPTVAALMMAAGLLAGVGPARRGLRIQPTEALRAE